MLSDLMRAGGYSVNYINMRSRGLPAAFGLYVCDELQEGAAYSRQAKRRLYRGLCAVQSKPGWDNLVGVYVDVSEGKNRSRSAFRQLKADVRAGFFRRVLVVHPRDVFGDLLVCQELDELSRDVEGFELVDLKEYRLSGWQSVCQV